MGRHYLAECKQCGNQFEVWTGIGEVGYRLHCTDCGRVRLVKVEEILQIQRMYFRKEISRDEFHAAVEGELEACDCSGRFRFGTRPRCPQCLSTKFDMSKFLGIWD